VPRVVKQKASNKGASPEAPLSVSTKVIKRVNPLLNLWWYDPVIVAKHESKPTIYKRYSQTTETVNIDSKRKSLRFNPSPMWVTYGKLLAEDRGYITELYGLREVRKRYGLSLNGMHYWNKYILPESFNLFVYDGTKKKYWTRIQLVVMDCVLRHLEKQGVLMLTRDETDVLGLIDHGCAVLSEHYANLYEKRADNATFDKNRIKLFV
jgi:hypothetical protein